MGNGNIVLVVKWNPMTADYKELFDSFHTCLIFLLFSQKKGGHFIFHWAVILPQSISIWTQREAAKGMLWKDVVIYILYVSWALKSKDDVTHYNHNLWEPNLGSQQNSPRLLTISFFFFWLSGHFGHPVVPEQRNLTVGCCQVSVWNCHEHYENTYERAYALFFPSFPFDTVYRKKAVKKLSRIIMFQYFFGKS